MIGLVENGDRILIDVHERRLELLVDDDVLAERRAKMDASRAPVAAGGPDPPGDRRTAGLRAHGDGRLDGCGARPEPLKNERERQTGAENRASRSAVR